MAGKFGKWVSSALPSTIVLLLSLVLSFAVVSPSSHLTHAAELSKAKTEKSDLSDTNTATPMSDTVQLAHNYSGRYWDLGNAITVFAVVQMLGFLYALGEKKEFLNMVRNRRPLVAIFTIASGLIYCLLVFQCYSGENSALSKLLPHSQIFVSTSKSAMVYRILVIVLMTLLGSIVLALDWKWHRNRQPFMKP